MTTKFFREQVSGRDCEIQVRFRVPSPTDLAGIRERLTRQTLGARDRRSIAGELARRIDSLTVRHATAVPLFHLDAVTADDLLSEPWRPLVPRLAHVVLLDDPEATRGPRLPESVWLEKFATRLAELPKPAGLPESTDLAGASR